MYHPPRFLTVALLEELLSAFEWPTPYSLEDAQPDGVIMHLSACSLFFCEGFEGEMFVEFLSENTGVDLPLKLFHALQVHRPAVDAPPLKLINNTEPAASLSKVRDGILDLCTILLARLQPVLEGDFSWVQIHLTQEATRRAQEAEALRSREDRLAGALLGCALGDALGLACEGMFAQAIAKRFRSLRRFHLLGEIGFISDDTEQSALLAHSLHLLQLLSGGIEREAEVLQRRFRRAMIAWFWRLPFGVGLSTLRACLRMSLGMASPGIYSAGNGATMRAPIVGVIYAQDEARRRRFVRVTTILTHTHPVGIEGALYAAEVAAALARGESAMEAIIVGRSLLKEAKLLSAIDEALRLHKEAVDFTEAAKSLGNTGYVVHTLGLASFGLLSAGDEIQEALIELISVGGDTDTIAAILGAWLGAQRGATALPELVELIHDGPFGPSHLRALAFALAHGTPAPRFSALRALLRNLALYPVILAHGFRRLLP